MLLASLAPPLVTTAQVNAGGNRILATLINEGVKLLAGTTVTSLAVSTCGLGLILAIVTLHSLSLSLSVIDRV